MARQISLHEVIDAIDDVLAKIDEQAEKSAGAAPERARATSTLQDVKRQLRELCAASDGGFEYWIINN